MQNIILITREKAERVIAVSVFLCNRLVEGSIFCDFINHLPLADGEKMFARRVLMGREYDLETRPSFAFEDLIKLDDRMIQKILRETDSSHLAVALQDSGEELQEKIFRNMSRRAALMIKEDMEFMGPVNQEDSVMMKQVISNTCFSVMSKGVEERIEKQFAVSSSEKDEDEDSGGLWREYDEEKNHAVLTFTGVVGVCKKAAVMLFDSKKSAFQYCETINNLHTAGDVFVYAQRAEQMVEYETEEPLLTRFDQIFYYDDVILGKALAKVGYKTIIDAVKGLDTRSREKVLMALPDYLEKKVLDELESRLKMTKEYKGSFSRMMEVKFARQRIVNALITIDRKMKNGEKYGFYGEVFMS
ncbi:hypothetical protein FACS1894137_14720 [Spirochaetia bacterium]|nr:hypothetical protein FACS1894137_14720 [Spirochaetia bacterium]